MKKSVFAAAMLIALLFASVWNIHHMDRFSDSLEEGLRKAEELWTAGEYPAAEHEVRELIEEWCAEDGYTHIFIRHSEIDSASDCFYELLSALAEENAEAADAAAGKLRYHITSIRQMEHITLRSVF